MAHRLFGFAFFYSASGFPLASIQLALTRGPGSGDCGTIFSSWPPTVLLMALGAV